MRKRSLIMFALVATLVFYTGVGSGAETNTWVLDEEPVPEGRAVETLELYSEQQTMGESGKPMKVVEAQVQLPDQIVFAAATSPGDGTGSAHHDYYLVKIPFTLHPLSQNRNYKRFELRIDLDADAAIAFKLIPDEVVTDEDVVKNYNISAELGRAGLQLGGSGSYGVSFKRIRPVVRAYGEVSPHFYWVFNRQESAPVMRNNQICPFFRKIS